MSSVPQTAAERAVKGNDRYSLPPREFDGKHGRAYCSPWCGFGCTVSAFNRATREASELAARMGEGWEPRVWENGGWHYEVRKGKAEVKPSTTGGHITPDWIVTGYTGWMQTSPQFITQPMDSPMLAYEASVRLARAHFDAQLAAIDEVDPPQVFEAMIYDAHLPSMSARFRIPEGMPFRAAIYALAFLRAPTKEDEARWAHLPEPPAEGYDNG